MARYIQFGMPADEYHASPALGNSGIKALLESPLHYWANYINPDRPVRPTTDAMRAGTLLHTLVLEPESVDDRYVIKPEGTDFRTKEGKAWRDSVRPGQIIITADQYAAACAQRDSIMQIPDVARMLRLSKTEVSAFWTDVQTGVECKCRPDAVHILDTQTAVLLDLKTSADPSPSGFPRHVWKYGYHRQAAWYSSGYQQASGIDVAQFIFVAVGSEYPYAAAAYTLDADSLQQGADECEVALQIMSECRASGVWPGYGTTIQPISLPPYARASSEVEVSYE